jgi:pimeloyl-ACP methyl ester carboxylesterase
VLLHALGRDRPHVAGKSLGGWVALELARVLARSSASD